MGWLYPSNTAAVSVVCFECNVTRLQAWTRAKTVLHCPVLSPVENANALRLMSATEIDFYTKLLLLFILE